MNQKYCEAIVLDSWQQLKSHYSDEKLISGAASSHLWGIRDTESRKLQNDYFYRSHQRLALLTSLLCNHVPKGAAVLDAGAGNGLMAATLRSLHYQTTACDLFDEMPVLDAISLPYIKWHLEADRAPFEDNSLDAVVFSQAIEHLTFGPKNALSELCRILKPGGYLLIDAPNISSFHNISRLIRGRSFMWDLDSAYLDNEPVIHNGVPYYDRHNHEYSMQELELIAGYFNLEIVQSAYYSSYDIRRGKLALFAARIRDAIPHFRHYLYTLYRKPA